MKKDAIRVISYQDRSNYKKALGFMDYKDVTHVANVTGTDLAEDRPYVTLDGYEHDSVYVPNLICIGEKLIAIIQGTHPKVEFGDLDVYARADGTLWILEEDFQKRFF